MITINKSVTEKSIYNATRYAWKISVNKAQKVDFVLAIVQGIIIGVFEPIEWKEARIENFPEFNEDIPGRIGFVGHEAIEKINRMYMRKRIPSEFRKKGAANPIKYNF